MPENWKTYNLGNLIEHQKGFAFKSKWYQNSGAIIVRVSDTTDNSIDISTCNKIDIDLASSYERFKIQFNDIVIATVGSWPPNYASVVGKVIKVPQEADGSLLNQNAVRLRTKNPEKFDQKFIYYLMKSKTFLKYIVHSAQGSANQASIKLTDIFNFSFSLPNISEQKSIASILSALDDKIELNLQMNKTLEEMAMALYKHWFVDFGPFQDGEFVDSELGEIPKGWEVKQLEDIIKFSNGYAFKSKQLLKEEEPDTFHIFKMGHIQKGGGLKADGTKSWIKKRDCKGLDKFILRTGDILMSMTDMKDNMTILGHTALMNENNKFIVNQRVGLLRVANNCGIDYPYVFLLTNSSDFIQRLRSQANSGVQVNLSTNAIKSAKVVVPNKEVNVKFNNITLPYYESINQNALENQTLTKLRDTLLPKLISGEVRVKDAEKTLSEVL
ncbi:restriction endonuclease subunit S [Salinimicrobium oceani]|uniref:Restriction endonuclease subunit S n=1 Tax=Salinimicrobium oceani TaxID=2722702 RepID=A0ABX1CVY7_9FLAO|nr:restriction endonuclease subunit S [Salinimicrobium oceani]NJW52446.1 restriction endonuclease subunit S [Salinimicrobium oceani]